MIYLKVLDYYIFILFLLFVNFVNSEGKENQKEKLEEKAESSNAINERNVQQKDGNLKGILKKEKDFIKKEERNVRFINVPVNKKEKDEKANFKKPVAEEATKLGLTEEFKKISSRFDLVLYNDDPLIDDLYQIKKLNPKIIKYINNEKTFNIFYETFNKIFKELIEEKGKNTDKFNWFVEYKFTKLNKYIKTLKEKKFFEILNEIFKVKEKTLEQSFDNTEILIEYFEKTYKELEKNLKEFDYEKKENEKIEEIKIIENEEVKEENIEEENDEKKNEGQIKEIKEKTEGEVIEEIKKIFVEWEKEMEKYKKLRKFIPEIEKIYNEISESFEKFSSEINEKDFIIFKYKFEKIRKEYSQINFFFKNAKGFDVLFKSFETFINEKKENQNKLKGAEIKYKEFYETLELFEENNFSNLLKAKETCEIIEAKFKGKEEFEEFNCDELKKVLEYIGIKFVKEEEDINDKENEVEIHKEIQKIFVELKNNWKKENPTITEKARNYTKKVQSKIKKIFEKKEKKENDSPMIKVNNKNYLSKFP
ncbi:hypothetical protein ACQ4LE_009867, partial [Meloidogyne hapla]